MRRMLITIVVLAVLAAACSGSDEGRQTAADAESAAQAGAAATEAAAGDAEEADQAEASTGEPGTVVPIEATTFDRIVKDGTMRIEVADGGFDAAFGRVVDVAQRLGGGVAASQTSVTDDGYTSGSLTVRVPVESYEQLLVEIGEIGDVRHRSVTSQDVSAEFVDLEARRRQLQAQEEFYLGLLAETEDVQSAVTVRGELDRIQTDIERITGRLNVLEDRTSFSTLTVELFEPGAPVPETTPHRGLARYWQTGLDALVAAVGTMLVVALGLLPLVLLVAVVLLIVRAVRRRPDEPAAAGR